MLRKPGHNKREDFSLTLYGVWKETAVCSNAGTCGHVHDVGVQMEISKNPKQNLF